MKIYHVANLFDCRNERDRERYTRAEKTWWQLYGAMGGLMVPAHSSKYDRDARSIGDKRDCPFIRDVIDVAVRLAEPGDAIMLTNRDSQIVKDAGNWLMEPLLSGEPVWSSRRDMDKIHRTWLSQSDIMDRGASFIGIDLVAFPVSWWVANQLADSPYPDLLLGYEGWDWCFKFAMGAACEVPPLIYHEMHQEPYWHQKRQIAPGQIHNRRLCDEWARKRPDYDELCKKWESLAGYKRKK